MKHRIAVVCYAAAAGISAMASMTSFLNGEWILGGGFACFAVSCIADALRSPRRPS